MPRKKRQDTRTRCCLLCRLDLPLRQFLAGDGGRGTATRCRDCLLALQAGPPPPRPSGARTTCRFCQRPRGTRDATCRECTNVYRTRLRRSGPSRPRQAARVALAREAIEREGPLTTDALAAEINLSKRWTIVVLHRSGLRRTLGERSGRAGRPALWSLPEARAPVQPDDIFDGAGFTQNDSFWRALQAAEVRLRAQVLASVRQLVAEGRPVSPAGQHYLDSVAAQAAR